jgi:hypothetical protein
MASDVRGDERAERHDLEASRPDIVERSPDEARADTGAFSRGRDVRVDEHHEAWLGAVADLADQLAVGGAS